MLIINKKGLPKLAHNHEINHVYYVGKGTLHIIALEDHTVFEYVWDGCSENFTEIITYPRTVIKDD